MHTQLPESVKPLLDDYIALMEKELPGLMTGLYLHGSTALDAFDPAQSDVDFITVTSRTCTPDDVARLAVIHQTLAAKYLRPPLQGSYLKKSDLGQFENSIEPQPYYSDGTLHPLGHHDINAVTWWLLKNRGVTLFGTEAQALEFSVDWDKLLSDMMQNLNTYWVRYTREPSRMMWLLSDYGVQWAVLGVLRQYYTFREQDITSKIGAGEYALKHLPERWHTIVQEALNIRTQTDTVFYSSRLTRAVEAFRFLRFIIRECNLD